MSSHEAILAGLQQARYSGEELPDLVGFGGTYDDLITQLERSLTAVGGKLVRVAQASDLAASIAEIEVVTQAERIFCAVPEAVDSNVQPRLIGELREIDDPRKLNHLDLAVAGGEFAVAENGAVWVDPSELAHRVVLFIAEHLVLVVRESQLVHNMHQAYERLGTELPGYGLFISGPSKTADIEQSLVIGAQGPRSLHVCLVAE